MPNYSDAEKQQIIEEVLDPNKISIYCATHMYFGPGKKNEFQPKMNCQKCWLVFYIHDIATTPPHLRAERIDELEQVIHHMVETVEAGKWDFRPWERPQISMRNEDEEDESTPKIEIVSN